MDSVIGLGFGDEGKGLVTSYLCAEGEPDPDNQTVIRFSGGHQAGHTVVFNGKRHVFSSFGSGTLQGYPTYWSEFCTLYPVGFLREWDVLKALDITPTIMVNPDCPITTPYDVRANREQNLKTGHGTVGVGYGTTLLRQENHFNLVVRDLFYPIVLRAKLQNIAEVYYRSQWSHQIDFELFYEQCVKVSDLITLGRYGDVSGHEIFEGSQGILLDKDCGFFPNVTRGNTTSKNAFSICSEIDNVYYVTRSYQTRHGSGFMTNEKSLNLKNNEEETNTLNPYQGAFRVGELDVELLKYALECDKPYTINSEKHLVITCLDQYPIDVPSLVEQLREVVDITSVLGSYGPECTNIKTIS